MAKEIGPKEKAMRAERERRWAEARKGRVVKPRPKVKPRDA